jgi:hypothetical protein
MTAGVSNRGTGNSGLFFERRAALEFSAEIIFVVFVFVLYRQALK